MTVEFTWKRGVSIEQCDFAKNVWSGLSEELKGKHRATPAVEFLFKVDLNVEELNGKDKDENHAIIEKCL